MHVASLLRKLFSCIQLGAFTPDEVMIDPGAVPRTATPAHRDRIRSKENSRTKKQQVEQDEDNTEHTCDEWAKNCEDRMRTPCMGRLGPLNGPVSVCVCVRRRQREYLFAARCCSSVGVVPFPLRRRWERRFFVCCVDGSRISLSISLSCCHAVAVKSHDGGYRYRPINSEVFEREVLTEPFPGTSPFYEQATSRVFLSGVFFHMKLRLGLYAHEKNEGPVIHSHGTHPPRSNSKGRTVRQGLETSTSSNAYQKLTKCLSLRRHDPI